MQSDPRKFETWLRMRPRSFEQEAVKHLIELLQNADSSKSRPGFHLHIAHLSDSDSIPMIRTAKQQGESSLRCAGSGIAFVLPTADRAIQYFTLVVSTCPTQTPSR